MRAAIALRAASSRCASSGGLISRSGGGSGPAAQVDSLTNVGRSASSSAMNASPAMGLLRASAIQLLNHSAAASSVSESSMSIFCAAWCAREGGAARVKARAV